MFINVQIQAMFVERVVEFMSPHSPESLSSIQTKYWLNENCSGSCLGQAIISIWGEIFANAPKPSGLFKSEEKQDSGILF